MNVDRNLQEALSAVKVLRRRRVLGLAASQEGKPQKNGEAGEFALGAARVCSVFCSFRRFVLGVLTSGASFSCRGAELSGEKAEAGSKG